MREHDMGKAKADLRFSTRELNRVIEGLRAFTILNAQLEGWASSQVTRLGKAKNRNRYTFFQRVTSWR